MRINGDCVLEEQSAWNIQNGTKKIIAGIVTVSLLTVIADSVCVIPTARQMTVCSSVSGETIRWNLPVQMGEVIRQEQIRILSVADTMEHSAEAMESPQVPVQEMTVDEPGSTAGDSRECSGRGNRNLAGRKCNRRACQ